MTRLRQLDRPKREDTIQRILLDFCKRNDGLVTGDPSDFLDQLQETLAREGIHLGTLAIYSALTRLRNKGPLDKEHGVWFIKSGHYLCGYCLRDRDIAFGEAAYLGQFKVG